MPIIYGPPPPKQLIVRRLRRKHLPRHIPRLLSPNKMNQTDGTLKMSVSRNILVVRTGGAVIGETEPMPVPEMHIQQALVRPVKANPSLGQRPQSKIILQVGSQHHHAAVETIRPADVRRGGEIDVHLQELVRGSDSHNIAVDVYNAPELRLAPQLDLGKCGY